MASEADVNDECIALLQESGYTREHFNISKEGSPNEEIKKLFTNLSKRGTNNLGRPDIVLECKSRNLLIVVECKRDIKFQGSENTNTDDITKHAIGGVKHYLQKINENDPRRNLVGIAFSGRKNAYMVAFYGICPMQGPHPHSIKTILSSKHNQPFVEWSKLWHLLYSFNNVHGCNGFEANGTLYCKVPSTLLPNISIQKGQVQRKYDENHTKEIQKALKEQKKIVPQGILMIVICNDEYHIVDGQHRLEAYKLLVNIFPKFEVVLQLIFVDTIAEMEKIFWNHHQSKQPSEADLELDKRRDPESKSVYDFAKTLVNWIEHKYKYNGKSIISVHGTKLPNMSNNLIEKELETLYKNNKNIQSLTFDAICEMVEKYNTKLSKNPPKTTRGTAYSALTLTKCKNFNCWLGLVSPKEWFSLVNASPIETINMDDSESNESQEA